LVTALVTGARKAYVIALAAPLFFVALPARPVSGPELLSTFYPSDLQSPHGPVSEVQLATDFVAVQSGALALHVHAAGKHFRLSEPVWVIGYKTEIFDSASKEPRENFLCHTFFGDGSVEQHSAEEGGPPERKAIYTDSFTHEVKLPEGFGLHLTPDDNLEWMPMFNNRGDSAAEVGMRARIQVIRQKDLVTPLRPLYAALYSVHLPHLYFVPPGGDEQEMTFDLPFEGRIHFIGTHIHPYAESIEVFNVSRNEQVWKSEKKTDAAGSMKGLTVYSSVEGYPVEILETFRLKVVYANPTGKPIDAMAGVFILYSRE
jgi:hypothetical protein